ncbi:MAG: hypothetical protein H5T34_00675 [Candidatus Methanomethyliales bacterium]|nr:hypothetical protein [Candidatus Methanomethylicales archaeon]
MPIERELYFDRVNEAHEKGKIGDDVLRRFFERLPTLERSVSSVERAFGLDYPPISFNPNLVILKYPNGFSQTVIYASTQIQKLNDKFRLCVEVTLPFLLFAKEDLLRACLAHEFLHYIFITLTLGNRSLEGLSSGKPITPDLQLVLDEAHTVKAEEWISDNELLSIIKKYFTPIISDPELEENIRENWIKRMLPIKEISVDDSMLRIPVLELDKIPLDKKIIELSKVKSKKSS